MLAFSAVFFKERKREEKTSTDKQTYRQMERQVGRQEGKQANRHNIQHKYSPWVRQTSIKTNKLTIISIVYNAQEKKGRIYQKTDTKKSFEILRFQ